MIKDSTLEENYMKKIGVILCGCGYKDGSEIHESVGVLWALSQYSGKISSIQCFAADDMQADVVNCLIGQPVAAERRNMLVESARIARGNVLPLSQMKPSEYDGLIIPGGFGAAKNLCTFAYKGSGGSVRKDLADILITMHKQGKPLGAICIAPAILALAFKGKSFELTVGAKSEASAEIEKLGHKHIVCKVNEAHFDRKNNIASTPAYMYDGAPSNEIFEGIRKLVGYII